MYGVAWQRAEDRCEEAHRWPFHQLHASTPSNDFKSTRIQMPAFIPAVVAGVASAAGSFLLSKVSVLAIGPVLLRGQQLGAPK